MRSRPPRALLLEREEALREILAEALRDLGFEVRAAGSRRQALEGLLEDPEVDLVVVDLVDPAVDGERFVEMVHELPLPERIPVIAMIDGERAGAPPRTVPLRKPFGLEELLSAVRAASAAEEGSRPAAVEDDAR